MKNIIDLCEYTLSHTLRGSIIANTKYRINIDTYHVSILVHTQSESVHIDMLVVLINVLLVGLPGGVTLELLLQ